jgi:hypothetical protein
MASNGIMFIQSIVKIGELVQKLERMHANTDSMLISEAYIYPSRKESRQEMILWN